MSTFKSYEKVERIEKEECEGLLEGTCYIYEKIDGANAQLYLDLDSVRIAFGSRNRVIGIGDKLLLGDDFRGLGKWVLDNEAKLLSFFDKYPFATIYGEWLVKHSIQYAQKYYNKFYTFDIVSCSDGLFCHPNDPIWNVLRSLFRYDDQEFIIIDSDAVVKDCRIDDLKPYLDLPSAFGSSFREGIVIKNYNFINKYGRMPYGKLLHKDFNEVKSKPKMNVNPNDVEAEITRMYCTKARVVKICNKIKDGGVVIKVADQNNVPRYSERVEIRQLEMKDIPKVIGMTFYDIISEDMNDILKKFRNPTIDFKRLSNLVSTETKKLYIEYLQENA